MRPRASSFAAFLMVLPFSRIGNHQALALVDQAAYAFATLSYWE